MRYSLPKETEQLRARLKLSKALQDLTESVDDAHNLSAEEAFLISLQAIELLQRVMGGPHWIFGPKNPELIVGDSLPASEMGSADQTFIEGRTIYPKNYKVEKSDKASLLNVQGIYKVLRLLRDAYLDEEEIPFRGEIAELREMRKQLEAEAQTMVEKPLVGTAPPSTEATTRTGKVPTPVVLQQGRNKAASKQDVKETRSRSRTHYRIRQLRGGSRGKG